MIKYHNRSYSALNIVLRNVTVQTVFGIVTAATIFKNICGIEWDIL